MELASKQQKVKKVFFLSNGFVNSNTAFNHFKGIKCT